MDTQKAAFWLGLTGYIPFGALTLATLLGGAYAPLAQTLLIGYAAVILSFLGGIRWGVAMLQSQKVPQAVALGISVLPSLWAWIAAAIGGPVSFLMFAVGFLAMGWWDNKLVAAGEVPGWFGTLRLVLTGLVTITMVIASFVVRF